MPDATENTPLAWPRYQIELLNGSFVIKFGPATLARIDRESGITVKQFLEMAKKPDEFPVFDVGMKIILAAVRSAHPSYTEDLLSDRIPPHRFAEILNGVAECWANGVAMALGPIADVSANPPIGDAAAPSTT